MVKSRLSVQSVQSLSHVWLFVTPWTTAHQASLSITNSNSCPLSRWCHLTISSSVIFLFSHPQSFPALGSFQMSQHFTLEGQCIRVLPMNIQDWFPLGWTDWISLQPKGLSRVFSNTTVQNSPWNSPGQNTGAALSLLQGIFPIQGMNPGFPHCRWILHQLSHKGSPRILEQVAYPFSRGSSLPRDPTRVPLNCRWILYQLSYQESPLL